MSIQALLISVAVTLVTVGVTFFYFRNRMNKTEQKVDLMFQLIQEHERNSRMAQHMQIQQMHNISNDSKENLINISDDDNDDHHIYDSDDSDDSDVVSDNEDNVENKLVINDNDNDNENTINVNLENTVKTISLSLDGAETNNIESLDDSNDLHVLDELDEVELSDTDPIEVNNTHVELKNENSDYGTLNNFVVTKKIINENENDSINEETSSVISEEEVENIDQHEDLEKEVNKEVKTVIPSINYSKLSKAQLKQLAQEKGLVGYNKLTKSGLVELLDTTS